MFGELSAHDVADIDRPAASLQHRWVRDGSLKLIVPSGSATPQLFDLEADPHETHNLADSQPGHVKRLRATLDDWWNPTRQQPQSSGR